MAKRRSSTIMAGLMVLATACTKQNIRECVNDTDCDYVSGTCTENPATGHHWCTLADPTCPSGSRWADVLTGDDLAGVCVAGEAPPDAAPPCDRLIAWWSQQTGQFDIRLAGLDGSGQRPLTTDGGVELPGAVWSPDGQRLAFARGDFIWVIDADGSNEVPLTSGGPDRRPRWSPDGTRIVFDRGGSEIWTVNSDGTGAIPLTTESSYAAEWSPDGAQIAFVSTRDGNREVYTISDAGTGEANLTNNAATDDGGQFEQLRWSPDGSTILFSSNRSGEYELWTMSSTGTSPRNLNTHMAGLNTTPAGVAWSPDGSRIFYADVGLGCVMGGLFVLDASGTNRQALFPTSGDCILRLDVARDGSRLALERAMISSDGDLEIWTSDLDGANELRITNAPGSDDAPVIRPCPQ
jgi:TolB protein